jgi:hypothetical protein
MYAFQPIPEPASESPPGNSPDAPDRPEPDCRLFLQHDRCFRTFFGGIAFAAGLCIALIPWTSGKRDGQGWELTVPLGAAASVFFALAALYRGTTVIDRKERTVTYRWGWLGWSIGTSVTPLDQFRGIALTRQIFATSAGRVARRYRMELVGATCNRRLYSSCNYEKARAQAREIAGWLALRVVSTASQ